MAQEMSNEQINAIQEEMMKHYVTDPLNIEAEIEDTTEKIATDLVLRSGISKFEFQGETFICKSRTVAKDFKQTVYVTVYNIEKAEKHGGHYQPYYLSADMEPGYSALDIMRTIIKTFLQSKADLLQPTELEDE